MATTKLLKLALVFVTLLPKSDQTWFKPKKLKILSYFPSESDKIFFADTFPWLVHNVPELRVQYYFKDGEAGGKRMCAVQNIEYTKEQAKYLQCEAKGEKDCIKEEFKEKKKYKTCIKKVYKQMKKAAYTFKKYEATKTPLLVIGWSKTYAKDKKDVLQFVCKYYYKKKQPIGCYDTYKYDKNNFIENWVEKWEKFSPETEFGKKKHDWKRYGKDNDEFADSDQKESEYDDKINSDDKVDDKKDKKYGGDANKFGDKSKFDDTKKGEDKKDKIKGKDTKDGEKKDDVKIETQKSDKKLKLDNNTKGKDKNDGVKKDDGKNNDKKDGDNKSDKKSESENKTKTKDKKDGIKPN